MRLLRFCVFALAALVVLSLGFALIPAEKPAPAEPPFSEQARAAALSAALDLRAAGLQLASTGAADSAALDPVVTLLTIQARALISPPAGPTQNPPAGSPQATASPASSASPGSAPEFVQALANSGTARLKDAETADGGMARLLAGTGTAQLLAAGRLAAAAGVPAPPGTAAPDAEGPGTAAASSPCPPISPTPAPEGTLPGTPPDTRQALAAAVSAEQQAVYGYQAALPRLAPAEAGPASEFLRLHKELAAAAEERLRLDCGASVPQQPGYVLDPGFLASPAAALGKLEAATLVSYGDVVAVSQGQDRKWALAALQSAAGRALRWGADPGPVPGLTLDAGQLPALPAGALPTGAGPAPSPAAP
ncbi:ferritin-like domain-containing protein [Arthrobacter sp. ISL-85]|nr:ferritin-like domain-containing protein [Arthrobacter sp. ISL-85]